MPDHIEVLTHHVPDIVYVPLSLLLVDRLVQDGRDGWSPLVRIRLQERQPGVYDLMVQQPSPADKLVIES